MTQKRKRILINLVIKDLVINKAEGDAFLAWRTAVWAHAYQVLAEAQAGTRTLPTPTEAVAEMPALVLP